MFRLLCHGRALGLIGLIDLIGLIGLSACSAPAPKTNQDAKPAPAPPTAPAVTKVDLQSLISREIEPLPLQTVTHPKGAWSLQVEAKGVTQKPHSGVTELVIDLGTTQALSCSIYEHGIDVGGTLARLIANTGRMVEYQVVAPVAAVPVGDTPVFMMDAVYLAKAEAGQALGELKIGIYGSQIAPVLCLHDEPGYRASFTRVLTGLLKTFKKQAAVDQPQFVELHLARVEDVPLGYYRRALYQSGEKRTLKNWGVMLFVPSPKQLRFEDTETTLELDKAGRVQKGLWIKGINGEVYTRLDVVREGPTRYKYSGTHEGKALHGVFQVKDKKGLSSELSIAEALRSLKANQKRLDVEEYHPGLDALKPVSVSYGRDPKDLTKFQLTVNDGNMTGVIDEQGLFKRIEAAAGQAVMVSERVMSNGKL